MLFVLKQHHPASNASAFVPTFSKTEECIEGYNNLRESVKKLLWMCLFKIYSAYKGIAVEKGMILEVLESFVAQDLLAINVSDA